MRVINSEEGCGQERVLSMFLWWAVPTAPGAVVFLLLQSGDADSIMTCFGWLSELEFLGFIDDRIVTGLALQTPIQSISVANAEECWY